MIFSLYQITGPYKTSLVVPPVPVGLGHVAVASVVGIYFGITTDAHQRQASHASTRDGTALHNSIQTHGWGAFRMEVIETGLSKDEAEMKEKQAIALARFSGRLVYNQT
jgi:predicted GIY-YIG superfamily endonuclease